MKGLTVIALLLLPGLLSAQSGSRKDVPGGAIYALPRTNIEVSVEVKKDTYIPGPYASYAGLLLSVENVSPKEETSYRTGKIAMKSVIEADYGQMYFLPANTDLNSSFIALSKEGLIFTLDESKEIIMDLSGEYKNYVPFPDQLPSFPMSTQKENLFDRIKTDSGFVGVPYQQSIVNKKDPQSKAEEAAKFLFMLRKRRFELITGDVEHAFSGNSMKDALDEIARLEAEYLSLFLGKHRIESREYKFYVTPEKAAVSKSYEVFNFSESEGIVSETTRSSIPFTMTVTPSGKISAAAGIATGSAPGGLHYRIPETANIQLFRGSKEISSGPALVYQLGRELVISSSERKK
ncbi:MAG: DUF4831 family protein [Prevotellaceae bacterium]|jgi:hypothetical protein|nr:DUF4831 family protein [Prevotellaceae bacterium]